MKAIPFATALLGLLVLLLGAGISTARGIHGTLRAFMGQPNNRVELNGTILTITDPRHQRQIVPVSGASANPPIDQWLPNAVKETEYVPHGASASEAGVATQLELSGGPMKMQQRYWLWSGEDADRLVRAGPAMLVLGSLNEEGIPGPWAALQRVDAETIRMVTKSATGERKRWEFPSASAEGREFDLGWVAGLKLRIARWIPQAEKRVNYRAVSPPDGIPVAHIQPTYGSPSFWLELGAFSRRKLADGDYEFRLSQREFQLPFSVQLEHPQSSSDYRARIRIVDAGSVQILELFPNHPIEYAGYRISPASSASLLEINRDPGGWLKLAGAGLLAIGVIAILAQKAATRRKAQ